MATVHPFESARHKYLRAYEHLQSLKGILTRVGARGGWAASCEVSFDAESTEAVVRIASLPTVPSDLPPTVGDVLGNLRQSLDHLAWACVALGATPVLTRPQAVYFPIVDDVATWETKAKKALPGVGDPHLAAIRDVQPFSGSRPGDALARLRDQSNPDKHRVSVSVSHQALDAHATLRTNWEVSHPSEVVGAGSTISVGDEILRLPLRPFVGQPLRLHVVGEVQCVPVLEGGSGPLLEDLWEMYLATQGILSDCEAVT